MDITKREKEVVTEALNMNIKGRQRMKLLGHQIDIAKEEEIVLRSFLFKLSKIEASDLSTV